MDPTKGPGAVQPADAEPVPLEALLLPTPAGPAGDPVPLEDLLLPDPPPARSPAVPARGSSPAPTPATGVPPQAARRRIAWASAIAVALLAAAAGGAWLLLRRAPPHAADAPAPPTAPTSPSPPAATEPAARAPAAEQPSVPSDKLFGGRTAEWWRQRMALLAGRSDAESRRLLAVTQQRAVRLGIVRAVSPASPAPAGPPTEAR